MKHPLLAFAFTLAAASGAAAQDGLTPTDVLDFGQLALNARLQFASGTGDFKTSTTTLDADFKQFEAIFGGAVGLGMGFEVEVLIPYQFVGESKIEGSSFEFETEEIGLGDLAISPVFRILKDGADGPQLIVGAIAVAPTGKAELAEAEQKVGPITVTEGEEGGIGDNIWRFGALAGVSKRLGLAEPYLTVSWLSGDEAKYDSNTVDVNKIDRPDLWTVTAGAEFHATPQVTIDVRGSLNIVGEQTTTDQSGAEEVEEAHFTHSWQAQLYFTAGSGVTLILGVAVSFIEDHELDEAANTTLEDTFIWGALIGVHINLGM